MRRRAAAVSRSWTACAASAGPRSGARDRPHDRSRSPCMRRAPPAAGRPRNPSRREPGTARSRPHRSCPGTPGSTRPGSSPRDPRPSLPSPGSAVVSGRRRTDCAARHSSHSFKRRDDCWRGNSGKSCSTPRAIPSSYRVEVTMDTRALILLCSGLLLAGPAVRGASADRPDFNREIRPILSDNCFACHGPDDSTRKARLRLDRREGATEPSRSGALAIVPGDPDSSELIARITATDPGEVMPPPETGKSLTPEQVDVLRRWIASGADYQTHWAFVPPRRPPVPEPPADVLEAPISNPIDAFIAARLAQEGLRMSPEADRATLIRRVTLDLTGLPPSPEEVDAFLADPSPTAYEDLVDRLLTSPRYGE